MSVVCLMMCDRWWFSWNIPVLLTKSDVKQQCLIIYTISYIHLIIWYRLYILSELSYIIWQSQQNKSGEWHLNEYLSIPLCYLESTVLVKYYHLFMYITCLSSLSHREIVTCSKGHLCTWHFHHLFPLVLELLVQNVSPCALNKCILMFWLT
jgi:hypothetical protein